MRNKLLQLFNILFVILTFHISLNAQDFSSFESSLPTKNVSDQKKSREGHKYKTILLKSKYRGEQSKGVLYLDNTQRKKYQVQVSQGLITHLDGTPVNADVILPNRTLKLPNPTASIKDRKRLGWGIFVLDQFGQLYFSHRSERGVFHHSSFLAGGAVACAGEMIVENGRVRYVNNQSGHYQPPPAALEQLLDYFTQGGMQTDQIEVARFGVDF